MRRRRLADAVSGFDAATIATTHGFCQHVLAGLGVAGDVERDVTFVEDLSDLVEEVVDDLYVRRFHRDRTAAVRPSRGAPDRTSGGRQPARPPRAARATPGRRDADVGDAAPSRRSRARGGRDAQATQRGHDLRRPAHPAQEHARRRGARRRRLREAARAVPRRARRRVPGHRPDPVGDHAARLRRGRGDADPDRRPEAGGVLLPRSRRLRLPQRRRTAPSPRRRWRRTGAATRG